MTEDFREIVRSADGAVIMFCGCGQRWVVGVHHHCLACHLSCRSLWLLDRHECKVAP